MDNGHLTMDSWTTSFQTTIVTDWRWLVTNFQIVQLIQWPAVWEVSDSCHGPLSLIAIYSVGYEYGYQRMTDIDCNDTYTSLLTQDIRYTTQVVRYTKIYHDSMIIVSESDGASSATASHHIITSSSSPPQFLCSQLVTHTSTEYHTLPYPYPES